MLKEAIQNMVVITFQKYSKHLFCPPCLPYPKLNKQYIFLKSAGFFTSTARKNESSLVKKLFYLGKYFLGVPTSVFGYYL